MLVLLTPAGLLAASLALFRRVPATAPGTEGIAFSHRHHLFILVFTGVPLGAFLAYSVSHSMGAHLFWNGPVWLAVLPAMAWMMGQTGQTGGRHAPPAKRLEAHHYPGTAALCNGAPLCGTRVAVGALSRFVMNNYFWREASHEIEKIEAGLRQRTGKEPIVVGMNKFSAASELAFYNHDGGAMQVRSRNMFGGAAVMYELWHPSERPTSRPIILVGTKRQELEYDSEGKPLERWLHQPGPIRSHVILRAAALVLPYRAGLFGKMSAAL